MGRRLISMLALAAAIGFVVRLAPAQDDGGLPPVQSLPPAAPVAPPQEAPPKEAAPLPPAKDTRRTGPPARGLSDAKPGKPAPTPPAAGSAPRTAVPAGEPGDVPPLPAQQAPPAASTQGGLLAPFEPAAPISGPDDPGQLPGAAPPAARDSGVEQSQAPGPAGEVNPLPPALNRPGQAAAGAAPNVTPAETEGGVLPPERLQLGRQSIGLTVEVVGPPSLNLNTTATYRIFVRNGGTADANDVIVRDVLPQGLEFESSKPAEQREPGPVLVWRLGVIPGGGQKDIVVNVRPTKVGQFDHAATVFMRAGAKARTEVFEPRLKVEQTATSGKVLKGQPVQFKIFVSNIGNGPARNVKIQAKLSPGLRAEVSEADDVNVFVFPLGDLAPHERIELDTLVADTILGGEQSCKVEATSPDVAQGDEGATDTDIVPVVEPKLQMDLTGPSQRYTDTIATYTITLENNGSATARNVQAFATLPIGGVLVRQPLHARFYKASRQIRWDPIQLEPAEKEKTQLTFDVRMGGPGVYRVTANALGELCTRQSKVFPTTVSAMADIDLEVSEDRRVVDVNQMTTLRVTVTNRGSKDATNLLLSGRTSENVEVMRLSGTDVKGEKNPDNPTEFKFPPIERLGYGKTLILGIEVKAKKVGPANCRVFLKHDDEPLQEDVAVFKVTPHSAAP